MAKSQCSTRKKEEEIIDRAAPPGEIVYEAVYAEGEHELTRNKRGARVIRTRGRPFHGILDGSEALLQFYLPQARWTPLVTKLGYSVGFLIVILGRQQLFTKNTLTVILPLLRKKKISMLGNVGATLGDRLCTNLIGAFAFAWLLGHTNMFEENVRAIFAKMGESAIQPDFVTLVLRGTFAGWLIALMVWLLPFAESARIWVIIILAYVVGLANFPHVIAGNVETFYLVTTGGLSFADCVMKYLFPTLIGNVIGGVALVAVGAHAEFYEATDAAK